MVVWWGGSNTNESTVALLPSSRRTDCSSSSCTRYLAQSAVASTAPSPQLSGACGSKLSAETRLAPSSAPDVGGGGSCPPRERPEAGLTSDCCDVQWAAASSAIC